jgi:L-asparaginase II
MGAATNNPILVETTRGKLIESWHHGAFAVVDAAGRTVCAVGDIERPVFPRSSTKPFQAIPLITTGAASAYGLTASELAVACASHAGEPIHVATVRAMLGKAGLDESALRCGAHAPFSADAFEALAACGGIPTPLYNNCSGKHAGMLLVCEHMHWPLDSYTSVDHPLQLHIKSLLEQFCETTLTVDACGVDGCCAPTWAMPLQALALGFARFGKPDDLAPELADACRELREDCAHFPIMVAGTGCLATKVLSAFGEEIFIKTGAEGVYAGCLPGTGVGFALKIDDGARRAAEEVTVRLLAHLSPGAESALNKLHSTALRNWRGLTVGEVRTTAAIKKALGSK